jgi:hypothetical protein
MSLLAGWTRLFSEPAKLGGETPDPAEEPERQAK